jgi:cytochrome c biogenesis protein CcmG/thiol:disulfide interchange protein DsbE
MSPDGPELGSSAAGGRRQRHPSTQSRDGGRRRRRRVVVLAGVVAAVALLTSLFAFGLSHDPTVLTSPLIGRVAPAFSLRRLDGSGTVRLSELRGQVVVVNFWASWCRECRVEHPSLEAAWQRFQDQGVVFVGIPFQDSPSASAAYAKAMGGGWPLLSDPASTTALAYGVYGVPETFFIDARGRIAAKQVGPASYEMLTDQVTRLLEERTS